MSTLRFAVRDLMLADRICRRYQYDALVRLPMLAQATSRIRIGFNVAVTPYLHPYVWAKYLASLDAAMGDA